MPLVNPCDTHIVFVSESSKHVCRVYTPEQVGNMHWTIRARHVYAFGQIDNMHCDFVPLLCHHMPCFLLYIYLAKRLAFSAFGKVLVFMGLEIEVSYPQMSLMLMF